VATTKFVPWPIELRFCEPNSSTSQTKSPSRLAWFNLLASMFLIGLNMCIAYSRNVDIYVYMPDLMISC
jgi:hypothetical protein